MRSNDPTSPSNTTPQARLASATDDFIREALPAWLKRASQGQIKKLRDRFKEHNASQEQLRAATADLLPVARFAQQQFQALLAERLPAGAELAELQWVEVVPKFETTPGAGWPTYGPTSIRHPSLLRLMQNFPEDARFFNGTGLAALASDSVLLAADDALVGSCRALDAGARYQQLIDTVLTKTNRDLLAQDKRTGFRLAVDIAVLKGDINAWEQRALYEMATEHPDTFGPSARHTVGKLVMLGKPLVDALLIQLREVDGVIRSVLLYVPSDPLQSLRRYTSLQAMTDDLLTQLQQADYRQQWGQLVSLEDRPAFMKTLELRLKDAQPDLQLEISAIVEDVFLTFTRLQIQRLKDDARLLLVANADADRQAARRRLQAWEAAGLALVNLAGLFVPAVGALLLGQLVLQTLSEVFEAASDWAQGHQHEALQHMLSVAETLAYTGATVAGVAIVRSAFVEALEPIVMEAGQKRLWSGDLTQYESSPAGATLQPDGLYGAGASRWLRVQKRFYEVHRPTPTGSWRLRHPRHEGGFGPVVLHNAERGWRLILDRPLEWDDSAQMLDALWPQEPPIDARRAEQILTVAGVDKDRLRGLLVENRPTPASLRDTLRRFEADARIERFVSHLLSDTLVRSEQDILEWCSAQPEVAGPPTGVRERLQAAMPSLRRRVLEHLARPVEPTGSLGGLIARDFAGLPKAYFGEVTEGIGQAEHSAALEQAKLPVQAGANAQSLLRQARLSRALEGLYLSSVSSAESDHLVFSLLRDLPQWPKTLTLQLREATPFGQVLNEINPGAHAETAIRWVRANHQLHAYDAQGQVLAGQGPFTSVFDALLSSLPDGTLTAMGVNGDDRALKLRQVLEQRLPATRDQLFELLNIKSQAQWSSPPKRLQDGRVGYALSGRGRVAGTPRQRLLDGLRACYPGLDDQELSEELERLLQGSANPFSALAELRQDHERLSQALNGWVGAELNGARQAARQQCAEVILRAWRGQGGALPQVAGQPRGVRLILTHGLGEVATLPSLPGEVVFSRVRAMTINHSRVTHVISDFLHGFIHVQDLNLNGNSLLTLPAGVAYMPRLRTLRLARNRIRLNAEGVSALAGLAQLTGLDLSYNPLGSLHLRFNQLQQLVNLNLRHCQLATWPRDIELCTQLDFIDLRDNQLTEVGAETLQMPRDFRQGFVIDNNPLSRQSIARLHALDTLAESDEVLELDARSRSTWMAAFPPATQFERGLTWDALVRHAQSGPFFELLGRLAQCSDFERAQASLAEQVCNLLQSIQTDRGLRGTVFSLASEAPEHESQVVDLFSRMQVHLHVADAERLATTPGSGQALIALGRGLFNLDYVNLLARQQAVRLVEGNRALDAQTIVLYFRVRLRAALNLPGQPSTLRNADAVGVEPGAEDAIRHTIERAATAEQFNDDLSQRSFWQRYLRHRYPSAFSRMEDTHNRRVERISADRPQPTPEQLAQARRNLEDEYNLALEQLILRLTEVEAGPRREPGE